MTEHQPDESKLERVIRKIKRCLALSQSANQHEAATAMRQAQALMREHRLTEMDVHLSDVGEVESSFSRVTRRPLWDQQLSAVVAMTFGCQALRYTHYCPSLKRRVERAKFVGVTPSQHIAIYAYEALLTKLTLARKQYASGVRAGTYRSAYSPETAADHFALGWVSQVHDKLTELVPKGETDPLAAQPSNGHSLLAVEAQDQSLIAHYLSNQDIGKARKQREMELDLNAQIAGMLAGAKVELHAGLATGGDEQLALATA